MAKPAVTDPIRYEIFVHRLMNIAEEGRIALQKVCASPIVVQGGECMSSFYAADGTTILSASGHLRFSAGCEDAVKKIIESYSDNPGIGDGDQFYMNDPYIASTHVYDQMMVKPIFAEGKLIAWCASMTHTADNGGVLRGGATEIFHEGVRSCGIKLLENGVIRRDVFDNLTEQCRDPGYVGLDLKSRIASNNVCARGFLQLVEKYGFDFVTAACRKLNEDSERMARDRLAGLPDGIWRSRIYGSSVNLATGEPRIYSVHCKMTKSGSEIEFDYQGTGCQNDDANNSTYVGSWGQLFVALTSHLFWDVPWNGGMARPVTMKIPEGTMLNCRFPAACGGAPGVGMQLTGAASECIAKMLYAAGLEHDVNASYYGYGSTGGGSSTGGLGHMYGGHSQFGLPVGQGIYDIHASGFGAAPYRDGVDSAGHQNNPTVGISDIENIELQYPMVYLSRNHMTDSGGFGKYRGGLGLQRIILSRGSDDLTVNYSPFHGIPGGWGLFGGYPCGIGGNKYRLDPKALQKQFAKSRYPVYQQSADQWGEVNAPDLPPLTRMPLPEGCMIIDLAMVGSGYGDPLERDPDMVLEDVLNEAVSEDHASRIYGVALDAGGGSVDHKATAARRRRLRAARLKGSATPSGRKWTKRKTAPRRGRPILRFHESLEAVEYAGGRLGIACNRCGHAMGPATGNYKDHAVRRLRDKDAVTGLPLPGGRKALGHFMEYYCPGCATLLDVEVHCPSLEDKKMAPIWDTQLSEKTLNRAAKKKIQPWALAAE